jgi:hypothetical protein
MKAWTDYPIVQLGDIEDELAPVRECKVLSYDGDKYCEVEVGGVKTMFKAAYIYEREGRLGSVPRITNRRLHLLPRAAFNGTSAHE